MTNIDQSSLKGVGGKVQELVHGENPKGHDLKVLKADIKRMKKDKLVCGNGRTSGLRLKEGDDSLKQRLNVFNKEGIEDSELDEGMVDLHKIVKKEEAVDDCHSDDQYRGIEGSEKGNCDEEWSLSKVITDIYGYTDAKAEREENLLRDLEAGVGSFKRDDDYLEIFGNVVGLAEEIWEMENQNVRERAGKLEALMQRINRDVKEEYDQNEDILKAMKLLKEWFEQLETDFVCLLIHLMSLMPRIEEVVVKLQDFKSALEVIKKDKQGKVSRLVYRTLAVLGRKLGSNKETMYDRNEREILFKETQIHQLLIRFPDIILQLEYVLGTLNLYNSKRDNKEIVCSCEEVLRKSEEQLTQIQLKICSEPMDRYWEWKMTKIQKDLESSNNIYSSQMDTQKSKEVKFESEISDCARSQIMPRSKKQKVNW